MFASQFQLNFVVKYNLCIFLVHLNTRPNCVIVENLSWTSVLQDTTNNYTFDHIVVVVLSNFIKPDLLGQSRIHVGLCYNVVSQLIERDTVFVLYEHNLIYQLCFRVITW